MTRAWRTLTFFFWALLLVLVGTVFWLWWGIDDLRQPSAAPANLAAGSVTIAPAQQPTTHMVGVAPAATESPSLWSCAKTQVRIKQLEFAKSILNAHVGMAVTRFPQEVQSRVEADEPIYPPYESHSQTELERLAAAGDAKAAAVAGLRITQNGFLKTWPDLPANPSREERLVLEQKAEALLAGAIKAGVKGLLNEYSDLMYLRAFRLSPQRNGGVPRDGYSEAQARYVAMVQISAEHDDFYGAFSVSMDLERLSKGESDAGDPLKVEQFRQAYLEWFAPGLLTDLSSEERSARQWLQSLQRGVPEIEELKALRLRCGKPRRES